MSSNSYISINFLNYVEPRHLYINIDYLIKFIEEYWWTSMTPY